MVDFRTHNTMPADGFLQDPLANGWLALGLLTPLLPGTVSEVQGDATWRSEWLHSTSNRLATVFAGVHETGKRWLHSRDAMRASLPALD